MDEAQVLRARLVEELAIRDGRVRDAFLTVPREPFVSEFAAARGLEAVYRDDAIVTKVDEHGIPISSSSQPAIMAEMLERLALDPGAERDLGLVPARWKEREEALSPRVVFDGDEAAIAYRWRRR